MMLMKRGLIFLLVFLSLIVISYCTSSSSNEKDPFKSLGIPDLNPKALLAELDAESSNNSKKQSGKGLPQLKTIDDLPNFLKGSNLNEEEGIKVLTRFLIQDDFTLKKYGVVYDQSGFDGIASGERIAPIGTEDRLMQRARSSANIWFKEKFNKLEYDAYGAESLMDEIVPNWRIYKVLMIGKNGENTFIKVCLPLDESETALCSDKDELCGPRSQYVEKEKLKNEEYIQRIKSNHFFSKKKALGNIKLLPGEKMIAKEGDKKVVIDSSTHNTKFGNNGFYNPPSLETANGSMDPLLDAFRMKNNNMRGFNMPNQMGMNIPQNFQQPMLPNVNGFNPNFNNKYNGNLDNNNNMPLPSYNFKQRDSHGSHLQPNAAMIPGSLPLSTSLPNNNIDNAKLMNELMTMKTQLNQMMYSLKQKDEIINQQNLKLTHVAPENNIGNNFSQYQPAYMNNPTNNGMYNHNQNMNEGFLSR